MPRLKAFSSLITFLLFFSITSWSQKDKIYVWNFAMENSKETAMTKQWTQTYEVLLKKRITKIPISNQRRAAITALHRKDQLNKIGEYQVPDEIKRAMKEDGANIMAFGTISYQGYSGNYNIYVTFVDVFSNKILFADEGFINENKTSEYEVVKKILTSLLPPNNFLEGEQQQLLINNDHLGSSINPWNSFQVLYLEDFSNRHAPSFLQKIWNYRSKPNEYAYKVDESRKLYRFNILKHNFSRHKYIGLEDPKYRSGDAAMPYELDIVISNNRECMGNNCYGRGPSVRYDNKKKSCYAFVLNDDGLLRFIKIPTIYSTENIEVLYSKQIQVSANQKYKLGIIPIGNKFYLYLNGTKLGVIESQNDQSGVYGVYVSGKGEHLIDNVAIFRSIYRR